MEPGHPNRRHIGISDWCFPDGVLLVGVKLGVTGTRDGFSPAQSAWATHHAHRVVAGEGVSEFHYGDCTGVDEQMLWTLLKEGITPDLHIYPALVSDRWRAKTLLELTRIGYEGYIVQYSSLPPKTRNGFIAENCEELWAFPGSGGGTWDCLRKARALGRFGFIVYRDGQVEDL